MGAKRVFALMGIGLALGGCDDVTVGGENSRRPPPPPPPNTSHPSDATSRTFALRGFTLDQGEAWREIGFDLDGLRTQATGGPNECVSAAEHEDGEGGIDNVFGDVLMHDVALFFPILECEIEQAAIAGHGTLLLRIEGWNGLPDDADVAASLVRALDGSSSPADCGELDAQGDLLDGPGGAPLPPPDWSGDPDAFCVESESLDPVGGVPLLHSPHAYLSGGTLVADLPNGGEVVLTGDESSLRLPLGGGLLVATMSAGLDAIEGGVVAGRLPFDAVVTMGPDIGLCNDEALLRSLVAMADVLYAPSVSGAESMPCDAVSVGLPFVGREAIWAGVAEEPRPTPWACDPEATPEHPWPPEACCSHYDDASDRSSCGSYWDGT